MYFTRILLSIVFVLFASTALAAKPDNILVCHVGSELSSIGETYMENPDCTLPDGWDDEVDGEFTCPDAGKIDLISVSKKAKHIGNEAHSFGGDSDYAPVMADVGGDPADFEDHTVPLDGIDDGCETEELCPCLDLWDGPPFAAISFTSGSPPVLPADLTGATCSVSLNTQTSITALSGNLFFTATVFTNSTGTVAQCNATQFNTSNTADLRTDNPTMPNFFPDTAPGTPPAAGSPMEACKILLELRGCQF
jgi:hypothetical protein